MQEQPMFRESIKVAPGSGGWGERLFQHPAGSGSKFERTGLSMLCFPSLTPAEKGPNTLKRNGFGTHLKWSKTCELYAICFYIPQETRS